MWITALRRSVLPAPFRKCDAIMRDADRGDSKGGGTREQSSGRAQRGMGGTSGAESRPAGITKHESSRLDAYCVAAAALAVPRGCHMTSVPAHSLRRLTMRR